MNKGALKELLEQGQIIVDYINNHLLLAWNELTLLNQAIDQNKKMLNITLHHVRAMDTRPVAVDSRRIIFAFPSVVDNFVFFDESFIEWISGFATASGMVYILSPSMHRGYADELVGALKAKGLPYAFMNFILSPRDNADNDPFIFLQQNIYNASELIYGTIASAFELRGSSFYVAHSMLISQNYNFMVYPLVPAVDLDSSRISAALGVVGPADRIVKRTHVPNETVAAHNATVYAIACRWRTFLLDNQKNKTLKRIIEWQNTLDRQVVENKRLMMRYRGAITDEDIQELAVLNAEEVA